MGSPSKQSRSIVAQLLGASRTDVHPVMQNPLALHRASSDSAFRLPIQNTAIRSVVILLGLLTCRGAGAGVTFSDGTFNPGDWALTVETGGTGGTSSVAQITSGGNPGSYAQITNSVYPASEASQSAAAAFYLNTSATYTPPSQGAISTIDYSEDSILVGNGGGEGQSTNALLFQAGTFYWDRNQTIDTTETVWTHHSVSGLIASDFGAFVFSPTGDSIDYSRNPDFSASGDLIEFGFARGNSTPVGGPGYTEVAGIDNWSMTVDQVAEPGTSIDVAGLWMLLRRRRNQLCRFSIAK